MCSFLIISTFFFLLLLQIVVGQQVKCLKPVASFPARLLIFKPNCYPNRSLLFEERKTFLKKCQSCVMDKGVSNKDGGIPAMLFVFGTYNRPLGHRRISNGGGVGWIWACRYLWLRVSRELSAVYSQWLKKYHGKKLSALFWNPKFKLQWTAKTLRQFSELEAG